jgi:hypothetical protein
MSELMTKEDSERFVFANGYQDFPNTTDRECVVVAKDFDLTNKKLVAGELVDKDEADIAAELAIEFSALDAKYKENRKTALMSFDLTIFTDSTLSDDQKTDIVRVRQEWMDMTNQSNYPFDFIAPALDPVLW